MRAFPSALLSSLLSAAGATSITRISTPTFRHFISHLSDSMHPSLANSHPWWELIDHPRPLPPFPSLPPSIILSSATGSLFSPPHKPHQTFLLAPILSKLGFQELAMACRSEYGPSRPLKGAHISDSLLYVWSGPLTLFAPSTDSLHSCPSCSPIRLLREHLIPGLFSLPYLSKLTFRTKLEIASPGRCLIVTSSSATDSASDLPGSAIVRLLLRYAVAAFPCTLAIATYPDAAARRHHCLPSCRTP